MDIAAHESIVMQRHLLELFKDVLEKYNFLGSISNRHCGLLEEVGDV